METSNVQKSDSDKLSQNLYEKNKELVLVKNEIKDLMLELSDIKEERKSFLLNLRRFVIVLHLVLSVALMVIGPCLVLIQHRDPFLCALAIPGVFWLAVVTGSLFDVNDSLRSRL